MNECKKENRMKYKFLSKTKGILHIEKWNPSRLVKSIQKQIETLLQGAKGDEKKNQPNLEMRKGNIYYVMRMNVKNRNGNSSSSSVSGSKNEGALASREKCLIKIINEYENEKNQ